MVTLAMESLFNDGRTLALLIPIITIVGGLFLAFVSIIAKTIRAVTVAKQVEESRREIAAYVAEGTMSPDDAYKLLEAGKKKSSAGCWS